MMWKKIASLRLIFPKNWMPALDAALIKLQHEDESLFYRLLQGRICRITSSLSNNNLGFDMGYFCLNSKFLKSEGALVSLLVFWCFFRGGFFIWMKEAKKQEIQATLKTAEWLETKGYPIQLIEWVKAGGLEERVAAPPLIPKKQNG